MLNDSRVAFLIGLATTSLTFSVLIGTSTAIWVGLAISVTSIVALFFLAPQRAKVETEIRSMALGKASLKKGQQ